MVVAHMPVSSGTAGHGMAKHITPSRHDREVFSLACRCWPLLMGNVVEWYEFSVYGYLTPQMEANFFKGSSVSTWLVFAITFISRPMGGIVLGWISDRYGRRVSMNISIVGMLFATAGQGLLPSFRSSGQVFGTLGCALLLVLRFGQGISAGGEIGTILTYLGEVAPKTSLGSTMMLIPMTSCVAFFMANGVVALIAGTLGEEHMLQWGWRLPFILSVVPGLVAVWGRRKFPESEAFLEEMKHRLGAEVGRPLSAAARSMEAPNPGTAASPGDISVGCQGSADILDVFRSHGLALLISTGGVAGTAAFVYVSNIWCLSYLQSSGMPSEDVLIIGLVSRVMNLVLLPFVGMAIDTHGVGLMTFIGGIAMSVTGLPVFVVLALYPQRATALLGIGVIYTLAQSLATPMLFCAELFPTSVRTFCLGISWNVGICLFGGFGSVVSQVLLDISRFGPGLQMSAAGCITVISVVAALSLQRQGRLQLTHLRETPYFGRSRTEPGKTASADSEADLTAGPEHEWIAAPADGANRGYHNISSLSSAGNVMVAASSTLPHLIGHQSRESLGSKEDIALYQA